MRDCPDYLKGYFYESIAYQSYRTDPGLFSKTKLLCNLFCAASPRTPLPTIEECKHISSEDIAKQNCSLATFSPVNITCSVYEYYPSINLHFLSNSMEVDPVQSIETNNEDGTRNKAITITADSRDYPFVCQVSDIPGFSKDLVHEASIFVFTPPKESTTEESKLNTKSTKASGNQKSNTTGNNQFPPPQKKICVIDLREFKTVPLPPLNSWARTP